MSQPARPRHVDGSAAALPPTAVGSHLLPHLRRARDLIDSGYTERLDLDRLSAVAGLSKYHFLRCFTAAYGQTPAQYLTHRRIERAQDLLRATNLTVTEVCDLVGYSSLGSFSSRFTELVGVGPRAYQDRYAATGAPMIPGCFLFMIGLQDREPDRAEGVGPDRQRIGAGGQHVADGDSAIPEKP
ncbi:helix-turn-helix domain-containing protein [Microlunatus soli]|uniref:AraC-type DNA-binding protein n=1 Tax=Microlunatus soli TaxID=630515 RepID=A0A1H1PAU7_9ACTN|nr:AraC family transcriptional regulator [Microlunatus soli]SDS08418.1 AraC-type DNA-binding protein [Microlunatus soli]